MKDAVETMEISKLMEGKSAKEEYIHQAYHPQCVVVAPGSPMLTDSNGNPCVLHMYLPMQELTVDLQSNMANECQCQNRI